MGQTWNQDFTCSQHKCIWDRLQSSDSGVTGNNFNAIDEQFSFCYQRILLVSELFRQESSWLPFYSFLGVRTSIRQSGLWLAEGGFPALVQSCENWVGTEAGATQPITKRATLSFIAAVSPGKLRQSHQTEFCLGKAQGWEGFGQE